MSSGQERIMDTGAPHFRSMRRQYKNSGYTLAMIAREYIDNAVKIAGQIEVRVIVSSGMIERITISDDCEHGFVNINESGENNPFTLGHTRAGQDSDDELNEFGVGMKAAAIAAGNLFTVHTNVSGICHTVEFDFDRMEAEPSVNESYKPKCSIISMDEYRAIHPFARGSTIVLSGLHQRLHEITSQAQIQKEISEAISDAYSNYIHNGLIIRVNGVVVEEERDWFSDETCGLFTINTQILILEKPNSPRILIAIRTDRNTTYKKYDTSGQKRLKKSDKRELDRLVAQGYRVSHSMSDMGAIEIKSTTVLYSDAFDGENPPDAPLNHVHVHKDGRKYGSYPFEHRNDGNCNYSCHRIDLKSKQIGKELGITYNKQLQMNIQNDLTRMIREIINDNNSKLNSNTSSSKNQQLCQRYLTETNLDVLTCTERKLSTHHKEYRALLLLQQAQPALVVQEEVQEAIVLVQEEVQELVQPVVVQEEAEVQELVQLVVVQEEAEVQELVQLVVVQEEAAEVQELVQPVVVQEEAAEVQDELVQPVVLVQEEAEVQEQALPNLVPDSVREVGSSVHQRITRAKGENIIDYWRNSGQHPATFDKTLDDMIKSYQDRSAPDQIQDMLTELDSSSKCRILLTLIKKRHRLPEDDMWKGIELLRACRSKFGDAVVAGL